eukprot:NODE_7669_length_311_cov_45.370229_g6931_i0.p1 GENE.NODE_7669_length_311_cov_45.370229_g6931_i0~~NODE_7669_length_311_cov_45.370229_g6931_i0.p1  ORF type:complete len:58 (+),score=25.12 NODE_7669_length_311_cov_45.370229_g6931_i0:134-307(+)
MLLMLMRMALMLMVLLSGSGGWKIAHIPVANTKHTGDKKGECGVNKKKKKKKKKTLR